MIYLRIKRQLRSNCKYELFYYWNVNKTLDPDLKVRNLVCDHIYAIPHELIEEQKPTYFEYNVTFSFF